MLAGAILIHEALYIFRDGLGYLTNCFLPTFGLRLGPRAHAWVHGGLMATCGALLFMPQAGWLQLTCLGFLSLVIASYSLRLSNHLILAWFMMLTLCLARGVEQMETFVSLGVQGLIVLTYFFAFLHKLNADYFSPERSCASQLVDFLCWDRGVHSPGLIRFLRGVGIYGTVLVEGALPLLLLFPPTRPLALGVGVLFHFSMALLGIVNFSSMMYAGLMAFVPEQALLDATAQVRALPPLVIGASCGFSLLVVWVLTPRHANRHCPYVMRAPAWLIQLGFGAGTALLLLGIGMLSWRSLEVPGWALLGSLEQGTLLTLWAAFLVNGLGPYLGFKTEFSFAMFSNLRCEPWRHLFIPGNWRLFQGPDYVRIAHIEGLPPVSTLQGDPGALLAHRVLSQPEAYRYTRYFLRESLSRLSRAMSPGHPLRVRYVDREGSHEVDGDTSGKLPGSRGGLPVNFFPFILPDDPEAPHSEQGTVLNGKERQLF
ncbi:hypothetical protein CYFUS_007659 [Cystobacter fuscus]|uniref:HTTM domain-containing protein n=2 Tax=Cystobacter fuscus TaxID=43 RepID=A0A250JFC0_9BACT|nr:hypothetical protein CYFUS_007659 [Cystobacter fuscus]